MNKSSEQFNKYSEKEAHKESLKMREFTGENAKTEDYNVAEKLIEEEKINTRKEKFDKILKDRFDEFSPGNFESSLPEIDNITIIRGPINEKTGHIDILYATIFYKENEMPSHETFSILKDGTLSGKISKKLGITREQLYDDILYIAETIDMDFFENVSDEILPPDQLIMPEKEKRKMGEANPLPIDPRRIQFMKEQPNVLFGFNGFNSGFKGYYGFVFPKFIVLENNKVGNAMFFYNFDNRIEIDEKRFNLPPKKRLSREERQNILKQYWEPVAGFTKEEFKQVGAVRQYHPYMNNKQWEEKMQSEIKQRSF
jgi:hypothetical protein